MKQYEYEIKINGQTVEPADESIQEIYAGSKLIWKRKSKEELFADITLYRHKFTRRGLIVPVYLDKTSSNDIYDKSGHKVSEFDVTNLLNESDVGGFVWNDTPAYTVQGMYDFLYAAGAAENVLTRSTLNITDTSAQWKDYHYSVSNYLSTNKTTITGPGGNGILPLSRPLGATAGAEKFGPLCYVKDGSLITYAGYVVLAVCGDSLICAEDVIMQNSGFNFKMYGYITERTLSGEKVRQFFPARQRLLSNLSSLASGSEHPRHY